MTTARQLIEKGRIEGIELGIEKGIEQGIERGIEQGIERGIEKGLDIGRRETLRLVLERRFGPLAEPSAYRLSHASAAEIERWLDRMLEASSVDDALS